MKGENMNNWQITGFLAILIFGFLLICGCTRSPETGYNAIYPDASYSVSPESENSLTGTKTFTVEGIFTNKGTKPYTFWGGLTLLDALTVPIEYQGETMTLNPGENKTIIKTFVVGYRFKFKEVHITVQPCPISLQNTNVGTCNTTGWI